MKTPIDAYSLHSRIMPAIISVLPFLILLYFLSEMSSLEDVIAYLGTLRFYGGLTISLVFIYAFAMVARITSKAFESACFKQKNGFPTVLPLSQVKKQYQYQGRMLGMWVIPTHGGQKHLATKILNWTFYLHWVMVDKK